MFYTNILVEYKTESQEKELSSLMKKGSHVKETEKPLENSLQCWDFSYLNKPAQKHWPSCLTAGGLGTDLGLGLSLPTLLVCQGCHNKTLQISWPKPQTCHKPGACRSKVRVLAALVLSDGCGGRICPSSLSLAWEEHLLSVSFHIINWRWEEKGTTEDEMGGWHRWLNGRELM